jgi:hypothetical protein
MLWFHRNPIKKSLEINFSQLTCPGSVESQMICSLLREKKLQLLKYFANPGMPLESVQNLFSEYISLLIGFVNDMSVTDQAVDSKLRFKISSKWTNSLNPPNSQYFLL